MSFNRRTGFLLQRCLEVFRFDQVAVSEITFPNPFGQLAGDEDLRLDLEKAQSIVHLSLETVLDLLRYARDILQTLRLRSSSLEHSLDYLSIFKFGLRQVSLEQLGVQTLQGDVQQVDKIKHRLSLVHPGLRVQLVGHNYNLLHPLHEHRTDFLNPTLKSHQTREPLESCGSTYRLNQEVQNLQGMPGVLVEELGELVVAA